MSPIWRMPENQGRMAYVGDGALARAVSWLRQVMRRFGFMRSGRVERRL